MVAKLRELLIKGGQCGIALFEQVLNEGLLPVLQHLLLGKELFDVVSRLLPPAWPYFIAHRAGDNRHSPCTPLQVQPRHIGAETQ